MTVEIRIRWNQAEGVYVGYARGKDGAWVRIVSADTEATCADSARVYTGARWVQIVA